jgi:hypothetical protein
VRALLTAAAYAGGGWTKVVETHLVSCVSALRAGWLEREKEQQKEAMTAAAAHLRLIIAL